MRALSVMSLMWYVTMSQAAILDNWIASNLISVFSDQCDTLKSLLRLGYSDIESANDTDLSGIKFVYKDSSVEIIMNAATAEELVTSPFFATEQPLYVFLHGFMSSTEADSFTMISENLITTGNVNVIGVDSSSLIGFWYLHSTTYIHLIGELLGNVLLRLMDNGLNATDIHLVGHSLGAHIASAAGRTVLAQNGSRIGRISGLDPAGPCFSDIENEWRLDIEDADFVDIVHTNAGIAGIEEAIGHVDFFLNGGSQQTGCLISTCDHSRSWTYFGEAILAPTSYPGLLCDSWTDFKLGNCANNTINYIGLNTSSSNTGQFYLQTAPVSPYGLGEEGLNYESEGLFSLLRIL